MNKTTVIFTNSRNATAETVLYQYDYGQILVIEGLNLPNPFSVDFGAEGASSTLTMLGNDGQVAIPDELLETGKSLVASIFFHEGENDGETEYRIRIPVVSRPTRTDIEPTPAQQSLIDQLLAEMESAVESAAASAEQAAQSAASFTGVTVEENYLVFTRSDS